MVGGFLSAFAAGFLMTAVPQFTGSFPCNRLELSAVTLLFAALLGVGFLENRTPFHMLAGLLFAFLILFFMRRFLARTYSPPKFFVFVGLGLGMGLLGAFLLAASDQGWTSARSAQCARLIFTQGMILSLTLGVGTHLLPAIWGWTDLPIQISRSSEKGKQPWRMIAPVAGLAMVLLLSFWIEVAIHTELGRGLRAGLVTILGIGYWRILKKPKARGKLAFWLWISAWCLIIGLWVPVVSPTHWVDGLHLSFIGGFGLMTFMVASRVTLAHGAYGVRLELRSVALTISSLLILLSAFTRILALVVPDAYLHHLAYAAATWILAVLIWGAVFVPKMIRLQESK